MHRLYLHCTKYNQHARHANARGSVGMSPWKILKNRYSDIEFGAFQDLTIAVSHFHLKLISD